MPPPVASASGAALKPVAVYAFVAAVGSVCVHSQWISPLVLAAPALWFVWRWRESEPLDILELTLRWMIPAGIALLLASAIAPGVVPRSVPGGEGITEHVSQWLAGTHGAPASAGWILAVGAGTLVVGIVGGAAAGFLGLSVLLGQFIVAASRVYGASDNLLVATLVAFPPWLTALLASVVVALPRLHAFSRRRVWKRQPPGDSAAPFPGWLPAITLLLLAFLLRLLIAGPWTRLVVALIH